MMYAKLALRNVKRSAKDYLIYVITLILSVGLFYGFMSIASPYYNESLPVKINLEMWLSLLVSHPRASDSQNQPLRQ